MCDEGVQMIKSKLKLLIGIPITALLLLILSAPLFRDRSPKTEIPKSGTNAWANIETQASYNIVNPEINGVKYGGTIDIYFDSDGNVKWRKAIK